MNVLDETSRYVESEKQHFRPDIQGLRALAVILVIIAHAKVPHFAGGYIGVDVFFVISGFVITELLLRETLSMAQSDQRLTSAIAILGRFYARRIRRIMPAATLVMIGTVLTAYYYLGPFTSIPLLEDLRWASTFRVNFHFITVGMDYFSQGLPPSLITHYWSLAVEEQFYFVVPLLLLLTAAVVGLRRHRLALSGVLALIVAWSAYESAQLTTGSPYAYFSPKTRFWEIGLGALLAALPTSWRTINARVATFVGWLALAIIVAAAYVLTDSSLVPGTLTWWACAPAGALLFFGSATLPFAPSRFFATKPLRYIGDISYSLYLFHWAWLKLPEQYAQIKYGVMTSLSPLARVEQIAAATLCAALSYRFFENPIRRSVWLDRRPWLTAVFAIVMISLVWLTAYLLGRYWTS